jgi:uncharacterized damage-inducible protein DinB
MKELLLRAARYNAWANGLFTAVIRNLPDEILDQEIISSFSSIRKTVIHVWSSEDTWLQRLESVPEPVWQGKFEGPITGVCDRWDESSASLIQFVEKSDEAFFTQRLSYKNLKGDACNDRIDAVLQHIFNHPTYHRGQLVTMLRQSGITTIPGTDLITYARMTE